MKKMVPGPQDSDAGAVPAGLAPDRRAGVLWLVPRARAAGLHFLLSMIAVGVAGALLVTKWYPGALIHAAGGVKLLMMIALIDLILGPLLTFVVFDRRKKSLPFDLGFIVVLQVAALVYGLHASYQGRPMYTVFVVDRFELVSAADIDPVEFRQAPERLRTPSSTGPQLVAFQPPSADREKLELAFAAAGGVDARFFLRYYVEYERLAGQVASVARPIADLDRFNPPAVVRRELDRLAATGAAVANLRFVPVQGRYEDLTMIVDSRDGRVWSLTRLKPWSD